MAKISCPHCGALVDSGRGVCPNCRAVIQKKSPLTPYLIVAGIIGVIILVVAVILLLPAPQSAPQPLPQVTVPPTAAAVQAASPPCTIAITGRKNPPAKIQLQVMTSTCSASEIAELRVSVNGVQKGTLGSGPGSSATFDGTSGTNTIIVAAKFANGAESVVYQNGAL
jgi:hypothetical protein